MPRLVPLVGLALALAGCVREREAGPSGDARPEPVPEAEPSGPLGPLPGQRVLLRPGATLFTSFAADAESFPLPPSSGTPEGYVVAEVEAAKGERLELRAVRADAYVCGSLFGNEVDYELHLFVEREALVPVLSVAKQVVRADGTTLALEPGVPVEGVGPEASVSIGGVRFPVALGEDEVGLAYPRVDWEPAKVEGIELSFDVLIHDGARSFATANSPPLDRALARETIEGQIWYTFESACGRLKLRSSLASDDPELAGRGPPGLHGVIPGPSGHSLARRKRHRIGTCGQQAMWRVPVGAPLSFANGEPAGSVRREQLLPVAGALDGGRLCFESAGLQLCIAEAALARVELDPCAG